MSGCIGGDSCPSQLYSEDGSLAVGFNMLEIVTLNPYRRIYWVSLNHYILVRQTSPTITDPIETLQDWTRQSKL